MLIERNKDAFLSKIPLGRFGTSEECAQVVMMLVRNEYMTGQTVALSGGMSFL